jgi:hypothetical protein
MVEVEDEAAAGQASGSKGGENMDCNRKKKAGKQKNAAAGAVDGSTGSGVGWAGARRRRRPVGGV